MERAVFDQSSSLYEQMAALRQSESKRKGKEKLAVGGRHLAVT